MKITKSQLKQIIKEELEKVLEERVDPRDPFIRGVYKVLWNKGFNEETGEEVHQADLYQMVADAMNVETAEIAKDYRRFLGLMKDATISDHFGIRFDGTNLQGI